ncbi:MAG: serine/threonine-protein kinase [Isosphaeraceae bacterium]
MPMTSCLADEILRHLAAGETCTADQQDHLDTCSDCRSRFGWFSSNATASIDSGPLNTPPEPTPAKIGKYVIVGTLGRGGQGTVFRAVHEILGSDAIIKLAHKPLNTQGIDRNRLTSEGRLMAEIRHENLVQVFDVDIHEGRPWLAMELVRGCTLRQRSEQQRYSPRESARVVAAVAEAVAYLHTRGVVHLDIKPDNILIDQQGRPRLIDFGLARLQDFWSRGDDGPFGGTPAYMAPEQACSEVGRIGPATDVFNMGGVLYYLLTGRPPNEGKTPADILRHAQLCLVDREALIAPAIPKRLARIANDALAADLAKRPSASELAAELDRFATQKSRRTTLVVCLSVPFVVAGIWLSSQRGGDLLGNASPNPLRTGLKWSGTYYWTTDPTLTRQSIQLKITEHRGDSFTGLYEIRDGKRSYAFRVQGSVYKDAVQWRFLEQLAGAPQPNVVKYARVEGIINGNKDMSVRYSDGADQANIDMQQE